MRFGRYVITVCFEDETLLPGYLGSTLRGAFGAALKTSICGNLTRDCEQCRIAVRCLYAKTFEPKSFTTTANLRGIEPPPAYVIEPPTGLLTRLEKDAELTFTLLLFGDANSYLPFFLNAFEMMGRRGIGRRAGGPGGGAFLLRGVENNGHELFDPATGRLIGEPITEDIQLPLPPKVTSWTLSAQLLTPLRLKFQSQLQDTLSFSVLVRAALRRISSVFAVHGDGSPDLEYGRLAAEAEHIKTLSSQLRWLDWERYSNRQKRRMMLGGMVGAVSYAAVPGIYRPILETATLLHMGKQSTFGLGKLSLDWKSDPAE